MKAPVLSKQELFFALVIVTAPQVIKVRRTFIEVRKDGTVDSTTAQPERPLLKVIDPAFSFLFFSFFYYVHFAE